MAYFSVSMLYIFIQHWLSKQMWNYRICIWKIVWCMGVVHPWATIYVLSRGVSGQVCVSSPQGVYTWRSLPIHKCWPEVPADLCSGGSPASGRSARHTGVPLAGVPRAWRLACSFHQVRVNSHSARPCLTQTRSHQRSAPWARDPHDPETDSQLPSGHHRVHC